MENNTIIFDTETTGFPNTFSFDKYYDPKLTEFYDSSRMVQLAYIVLDKDLEVISKNSFIISPNNFLIKNSHIHGINQEKAVNEGVDIKYCLINFYNELIKCKTVVCHNINFDVNVLSSECYRCNMNFIPEKLNKKNKFCTMKRGKDILKFLKYPKLSELHLYFYPEIVWQQKHDALDDCEKCLECYKRLI
jgi:DNA polymerase III epsilon subunit-like protein